ncbi:MAG: hypothetical protein K5739_03880 [Lachnospiraceae bacterium]|nr:hypothetical protein [Lachnospiraceae bacterium]
MSTRTLNAKRNIIVGVLSNCLIPVFAMVVNSAVVKQFSVEYIGLTSTFSSIFEMLNLAELGFSSAIIVNLYKPLKENNTAAVRGLLAYYKRVYRIVGLIIGIAGTIACLLLGKLVGDTGTIHENIVVLYFIYLAEKIIKYLFFAYKEALLNAIQRLDLIKTVYIIVYFTKSILQLLSVTVLKNFYLYAAVTAVSTFCYYYALHILSKKKYGQYYPEGEPGEETKHVIREQVAGVSVSNLVGVSRNSLRSLIVTSYLGLHLAGQYANYSTIFNAVLGFFLVITKAIQSGIGNSIVSEPVEKNYSNLTKMEFLQNVVITACTAYLLCLYQPFMKLWMGEKLMLPEPVMMLFVLNFYILAMSEVRNAFFSALGYWWKAKWLFIAEALLNVLLLVSLGKLFSIYGIIMATVFTLIFVNYIGITNLLFREYFRIRPKEFYINRIIYTLITVVTAGACYYACSLVRPEGIPGLALRVVVCSVTWMILLPAILLLVKREYVKESVAFIRQILKA